MSRIYICDIKMSKLFFKLYNFYFFIKCTIQEARILSMPNLIIINLSLYAQELFGFRIDNTSRTMHQYGQYFSEKIGMHAAHCMIAPNVIEALTSS